MIGSTLTEEGRNKLCGLLQRNLDIFAWKPADMTGVPRHIAEHHLNIWEGRQKKIGEAADRNQEIQEEVGKLVEAGIIKEVHYHDWLSNPVMIKKHDDNAYKGYRQIQMAKEDKEETAFITSQGIFYYTKMPLGLRNAEATYQRLVDKAFHKQIGRNLKVYVNDLVIKSRTEDKIVRDIEETFKTLREINMKLNLKKCTFGVEEGMFLGYKVNSIGLKVCPDKVNAVLILPSPKCLKDVQKLNGKLASLNRFLAKSAEKSLPFFKTLKKCTKKSNFHWTTEAKDAFKQMKQLIAELPLLMAPMENEELIVYLAAVKEAVSVVLMTERESKQMPIYFVSRALRGPYAHDLVVFGKLRCNAIVLTWIMNYVSKDVYMGLVYFENVAYVWKELESTYDRVDASHRLNSLWREFDTLTKLPKYVCEVKCACASSSELVLHQQLMKLMQFLMGLDDSYQPIMSALLTRDPLPKVKDAYTTVLREESNRGVPKSFGVSESKINASSFAAKTFNNNRRHSDNNNNNTKGSSSNSNVNMGHNPNLNCKNYGKIGHTINRCYEIVGFPLGFKRNANIGKQSFDANTDVKINGKQSYSSLSFGFTFEQMQKLLSLINDNTSGSIHANMAGKASFFNGANQHLTVSTVVKVLSFSTRSLHTTWTLATISHVGNLKLYNNVILYDVLVVPGYCDWKKDKILRTGSEFGGLYLFDMIKDNCV
ncbi:reverse transcriptase domain-containing protein, partial [Tanacetum coccineum]